MRRIDNIEELVFTDKLKSKANFNIRMKGLGNSLLKINKFFYEFLNEYNIPSCYKGIDLNKLILEYNSNINLFFRIVNVVEKRYIKYVNQTESSLLSYPVYESFIDRERKVLLNDTHLVAYNLLRLEDYKSILRISSKMNAVLKSFFERRGFILSSFDCTFCFGNENRILFYRGFDYSSIKLLPMDNKIKPSFLRLISKDSVKQFNEQLLQIINLR